MKKLIECPVCNGDGTIPSYNLDCDLRNCFLCHGTGVISEDELQSFKKAQEDAKIY